MQKLNTTYVPLHKKSLFSSRVTGQKTQDEKWFQQDDAGAERRSFDLELHHYHAGRHQPASTASGIAFTRTAVTREEGYSKATPFGPGMSIFVRAGAPLGDRLTAGSSSAKCMPHNLQVFAGTNAWINVPAEACVP